VQARRPRRCCVSSSGKPPFDSITHPTKQDRRRLTAQEQLAQPVWIVRRRRLHGLDAFADPPERVQQDR